MENIVNYIGGKLVQPASARFLDNFDPSTGSVYSQIADSDEVDEQHTVISLDGQRPHRYYLIWFTKLPASGGGFRGVISEAALRS